MKREHLLSIALLFVLCMPASGQTVLAGNLETISWTDHYRERTAVGYQWPGTLIIASEVSDVQVARLNYNAGKIADIYYPIGSDITEPRSAVILVSGDTDSHAIAAIGRPLKDTDQYLQWAQVIAERGMIAITYELGNPQFALESLVSWLVENHEDLGIDSSKLGFFSTNENGCTIGLETIIRESRNYTGPKPAFSIYYYGLMPLRSSKEIYLDVPILTVQTKDFADRGITASMEKFNSRAMKDGALLTALYYPDGEHFFDCNEDTPRAREIIQETLSFMMDHIDGSIR